MGLPSSRPPHVCFVAPAAWPVLYRDSCVATVGGAEVQQCFLARAFAERGYRVSMVCMDYGQPDAIAIDGITVYKCFKPHAGVPGVRFFHPRLTALWSAMRRANADVYYQRCAAGYTGIVGLFANMHRRRFVYAVAHDLDVAKDQTWKLFRRRGGWRDRQMFFAGLRSADAIVAQHAGQVADCGRWYGRDASVVPSCYAPPAGSHASRDGVVLWVSVLRSWKRPEMFLELARRLPQIPFRIVGGPSTEPHGREFFGRIKAEAESIQNLQFVGFVPYSEIESHFDSARVFVNTSEFEGFPNTFLQAWARGIPTVSLCDTGSTFDGRPVVTLASSLDNMVRAVRVVMEDDPCWEETGRHVRAYMHATHSPEVAVAAYAHVFERLRPIACRGSKASSDSVAGGRGSDDQGDVEPSVIGREGRSLL